MLTAMIGAITDYVNTKGRKKPDGSIDDGHDRDLRDYFFPRTGNVDEQGHDERMSLPGYMKDLVGWYMEPVNTLRNKLSPIVRVVAEATSNRNFYNEKIWDGENNSAPEDVLSALKYIGAFFLAELKHIGAFFVPMSVSGFLRERDRGAGKGMQVGQFLGTRTAPAYITRSPAERYMAAYSAEHHMGASAPTAASKLERQITVALRGGNVDKALEIAQKGTQDGIIGDKEIGRAMKSAETDALTAAYNRLPLSTAIEAYRLMNPGERARALPLLDDKLDRDLDRLPAAEQQRVMDKLTRVGLLH
jgi:hypothetical protein